MSEHFCKTCGGYLHSSTKHVCPPAWDCRLDDEHKHDSDWREVRAYDAESAAEKFAEEYDCRNEYSILQQGERCEEIAEVRAADGAITRWHIWAESVPHYYAREAEDHAPVTDEHPSCQPPLMNQDGDDGR